MSSVSGLLRSTSKGQLSYRNIDNNQLKNELDLLSSPPLSRPHQESNRSLSESIGLDSPPFTFNDLNYNLSSASDKDVVSSKSNSNLNCQSIAQALSDLDDEVEKCDLSKEDVFDTSLPVLSGRPSDVNESVLSPSSQPKKQATSCPVSPQFGITTTAILDEEAVWESIAQYRVLKRTMQFDDHDRALSFLMKGKEEELEGKIARMVERKEGLIKKKQDERLAVTKSKLQRLKEDHEKHHKKIHTKQQEIARHREKLEEEEKKRREQELSRVNEFKALIGDIQTNRNTFAHTLDGCPLKDRLPDIVEKYRAALDKICTQMSQQSVKTVTDEHVAKAKDYKEKSQQLVLVLKKYISEAEEKKKSEDAQKEQETKKKEEEKKIEAEAAQDCRVQSLAYVLNEFKVKATQLADVDQTVQAFISNTDMKKFRFDLQRAVNTPINAISPVSGSHLRDKLRRLYALLTGQLVEVGNKQVSLNNSQEGKVFVENLVAKMLVKKGEEQVTSNHESAFAIASVIVGLWMEIPVVGELFLAHLQSMCPYVLPLYNTRQEGQTTQDYHRSLGYKIMEDGSVEEQDKFLHRMSGLMHLYCACMVTTPPPKGPPGSPACPHLLGIENAWMWLARTINMEPQPDITASMVYDVLFVTGHSLLAEYKIQFIKLLHILYKQYLPKLRSVSVTKSTVGRLEIFLETALHNNGRIEPPKGLLPPNFLLS